MTTRLTKPVAREVLTPRHGPLVVTLDRETIVFREKGRRTKFAVTYGRAYQLAAEIAARQAQAERKARRLARRQARH